MKFASLDKMITPKILTALYLLSSLAALVFLFFALANGRIEGVVLMIVILIFNRVFFEGLVVVFKNNEYLHDSREYLRIIANSLDEGRCMKNDRFGMDDIMKKWSEENKKDSHS